MVRVHLPAERHSPECHLPHRPHSERMDLLPFFFLFFFFFLSPSLTAATAVASAGASASATAAAGGGGVYYSGSA